MASIPVLFVLAAALEPGFALSALAVSSAVFEPGLSQPVGGSKIAWRSLRCGEG